MTGGPNDRLVGPGKFRLDSFKLTRRRQESKFRGLGAAGRLFMGLGPLNDLKPPPQDRRPAADGIRCQSPPCKPDLLSAPGPLKGCPENALKASPGRSWRRVPTLGPACGGFSLTRGGWHQVPIAVGASPTVQCGVAPRRSCWHLVPTSGGSV